MDGKRSSATTRRNHPSQPGGSARPRLASSDRARRYLALTAVVLCSSALLTIGNAAAEDDAAVATQGGWAYTQRSRGGTTEFMAATRADEDDVWLVLGCSADERLTVSAIHSTRFPFPLSVHASVQLHSRRVPKNSITAGVSQSKLLFIDPNPLRHILPLLIDDAQLFLSIPEQNGTMHDYTFSMQPNDVALKPIRLGCLNEIGDDEGAR
jgi:hypothetical protein